MKLKVISMVFLVAAVIIIAWPKKNTLTFIRLPIPVPFNYTWLDNTHVLTVDPIQAPTYTVNSVDIYTGSKRQICTFISHEYNPRWQNLISPDSKYLLQNHQLDTKPCIFVLSLSDGKIKVSSVPINFGGVYWQKDSKWATLIDRGPQFHIVDRQILVGDPRKGTNYISKVKNFTGGLVGVNNHNEIVTVSQTGLYLSNDRQPIKLMMNSPEVGACPELSPDGRQIAWTTSKSYDPFSFFHYWMPFEWNPKCIRHLYLSDSRGANLRPIGKLPDMDETKHYFNLSWTPDSRHLVYLDDQDFLNMLDISGK